MTVIRNNSISGINSITAQSGALNFYDSTGNTLSIGASVSGNITGDVTGNLTGNVTVATGATISGSTNTITASTNGSERLRITSDGNIGIGTFGPTTKFEVGDVSGGVRTPDFSINTVSTASSITIGRLSSVGSDSTSFRIRDRVDRTILYTYVSGVDVGQLNYSSTNLTIKNGNLVFSTAGTGIDFSATADGSGTMTSELLDDYEEGTYTPTDVSGAGLSFSAAGGFYTKIGRLVTCFFYVTFPSTANTSPVAIGGLPFTTGNNVAGGVWTGAVSYNTYGSVALIGPSSVTSFNLGIPGGTDITNANMSLKVIRGSFSYYVA